MFAQSSDPQFAFYFQELLALANGAAGSNTGEVLRAASQIVPGDFESFYSEFKFLADAIHEQGVQAEAKGYNISASSAYFRSASYYRAADFFIHGNVSDPRLYTLWDKQMADFDKATAQLPAPAERVTVQASNFTIPVIFYPAHPHTRRRSGSKKSCSPERRIPTLLVGSGYDGAQEALYHSICYAVLARGWNCATYEGPGQPTVRRQQGLGFRPDWWSVVTPVVDYLHTRPDVDTRRVALGGWSFGGTLAPLAASRERRLAAVLAVDGLWDLLDAQLPGMPGFMRAAFESGNGTAFDAVAWAVYRSPEAPSLFRWAMDQGLWAFKTDSPYDWLRQLGMYNLEGGVLDAVEAPLFVASGQHDTMAPGQAEIVAKHLKPEKGDAYVLFKTELGAGEHCQLGAEGQLALQALDWLAGVFDRVGSATKGM
ncbi:uncharacterized protein E0L32_006107 [Thyridium curvatum]|uniref:Xaa-Pro dipeptidyl-peptidase-like domain-containing protein n=1 Tax=Thyridium curvatum TaxID=1093900 RepID=A0A507B0X2_9PEZI|nr:uncharacterized protein E0L32_006107 [Thyridium curvatum]TPX13377.1 hypothetical protein E0L32_006107 [Thyridium curvatum]